MTLHNQFVEGKSSRPDNLNLRLHRALSWLAKAEKLKDDNTPLAKPLRHLWGDIYAIPVVVLS